ncbi:GNAT family N-acetyltransferase [Streptomyces capparidis]
MGMSVTISPAADGDAESILKLQYLCFQSEAELYGDYSIEPLTQTLDELRAELASARVLVARLGSEVVGSVRGTVEEDGSAAIGKLIVHPRMQRHGLGGRLLRAIEARLAEEAQVKRYRLSTGHRSEGNLRLYRRFGYETVGTDRISRSLDVITLEKPVFAAGAAGTALAASA